MLKSLFFSVLPFSGISLCGWTDWAVIPPILGAALLCSSRAGSDMWLLPWRNHQYGLRLEPQFSRDLVTARFEPEAAGSQSATLTRIVYIFFELSNLPMSSSVAFWAQTQNLMTYFSFTEAGTMCKRPDRQLYFFRKFFINKSVFFFPKNYCTMGI